MYQDKKNPCYVGVFKGFSALFSCNENSPLKLKNVAKNVAEMSHPQTLVALRFKALFSRFGTRHLKGGRSNPYVRFFYRKSPQIFHSKNKKKTCYGLF